MSAVPFENTLLYLKKESTQANIVFVWAVLLLLFIWFLWFFLASVSVVSVSDQARLRLPANEIQIIHAPLSGSVGKHALVLGGEVKKGDLLLALDSQEITLKLRALQASLQASEDEKQALFNEFSLILSQEPSSSEAGRAAIASANARLAEALEHQKFTTNKMQRLKELIDIGGVSKLDIIAAEADAKKAKNKVKALEEELIQITQGNVLSKDENKARLQRLNSEMANLNNTIANLVGDIQLAELELNRRSIRSPVDGVLGDVANVYEGLWLEEGKNLATIVPKGDVLVEAKFSPEKAFGKIKPGQRGVLAFVGFPWTQYGRAEVLVERVAQEVRDGKVSVHLSLINKANSRVPFQHGMPVVVEIYTESLSPAQLLLRAAGKLSNND